jgi:hypothetical protein
MNNSARVQKIESEARALQDPEGLSMGEGLVVDRLEEVMKGARGKLEAEDKRQGGGGWGFTEDTDDVGVFELIGKEGGRREGREEEKRRRG